MPIPVNTFVRPRLNLGYGQDSSEGVNSLPELIAFNAEHNPGHVFGLQIRAGENVSPCKMTFAELHAAVERASAWLVASGATAGRTSRDTKVAPVAILLGSDIGIFIYMAALLRIGTPVLLLSARLTPIAIAHLIKATSPSTILINAQVSRSANETVDLLATDDSSFARPQFLHALGYEDFISGEHPNLQNLSIPPVYDAFKYEDLDAIIMHSSGTTGLPKPIYHAQAYLLIYAGCHRIPESREPSHFNVSSLPLYHGFGLLAPSLSLSIGLPFVLPPASIIPTARTVLNSLESTRARSMLSVPSILDDIVRLPGAAGLEALKKLDFIAIGGAPMKEAVAQELVSNGVNLLNHWGATEIGAIAPVQRPPLGYDWHYLIPRTDIGLEVTQLDDAGRTYRLIGRAPGWPEPFVVQDLLEVHPSDPAQFKILGRADDLIVLATGEKVRPTSMEAAVAEHPDVKAVLAFGDGQFSLGLLVELASSKSGLDLSLPANVDAVLETMEPHLERGNSFMDKHAKITKDMIVLTQPAIKPLVRTDKGSLARKATFFAFEEEIKECYERADVARAVPFPLYSADEGASLLSSLRALVGSTLGIDDIGTFSDESDFFEAGMDSLQASRLRRAIQNGLRVTKGISGPVPELAPDFVFEHSSVKSIFDVVAHIILGTYESDTGMDKEARRIAAMDDMVQRYAKKLTWYAEDALLAREARAASSHKRASTSKSTVLLTGSTGSLGCMLLAQLAGDPGVAKVICLNRPQQGGIDIRKRQADAMKKRGAHIDAEGWDKVVIYEADISRADFGLSDNEFEELLEVTHIIHNAWPVNFNRTLASFDSHVRALCNLARLSLLSAAKFPTDRRPRRILFASSIAVVGRFPLLHPEGPFDVPETPLDAANTAEFGYPEAKWVCERVLQTFSDLYGKPGHRQEEALVQTSSVRIGQMTGPEGSGAWNENEHFPIIVRTSQKLRALPDIDGSLSWMPVNRAGSAIVDFLFSKNFRPIYHMENPSRQSWSGLLENLASVLGGSDGPLPMIPYDEWLQRVRDLGSDPEKNVAYKVMDFLENDFVRMASGSVILGTDVAKRDSLTMVKSVALDKKHLAEYVAYWRSVGALQ